MTEEVQMRVVRATLDDHLRSSSRITSKLAKNAIGVAQRRLGKGGVFGVVNYNPSRTEIDPRWDRFRQGLRYDVVDTNNGLYLPEPDILVVRGQEFYTDQGSDVLIIGTTPKQNIPNGIPLDKALDIADEIEALKIVPSPYSVRGIGKFLEQHPEYLTRFDGIEVYNGEAAISFGANNKAQKLFDRFRKETDGRNHLLFEFVGDDGHSLYELGRNWREIEMPQDYSQFKDSPVILNRSLRAGHTLASDQRKPSVVGALDHIVDMITIIALGKIGIKI